MGGLHWRNFSFGRIPEVKPQIGGNFKASGQWDNRFRKGREALELPQSSPLLLVDLMVFEWGHMPIKGRMASKNLLRKEA
jgi:hypothetical protein